MAKKMHFEVPTQVVFYSFDDEKYIGGIAYGDEVICGCCGGTFEIAELYEFAPEGIEAIIEYAAWIDIEDAICGGDKPEV
jgi:hypothetical protein